MKHGQYLPRLCQWSLVCGSSVREKQVEIMLEIHNSLNVKKYFVIVCIDDKYVNLLFSDLQLQPHTAYVFYVKAWYDDEHFATFVSDGVIVDDLAPELSSSRKIKETRNSTTTEDVDFITSTSTVYIMWNNVFRDAHADIMSYSVNVEAFVGKSLAVQDFVHPTTRTTFSSLNLEPGIQYYTTVEACNTAGLCTTATSDGFMVSLLSASIQTDKLNKHIGYSCFNLFNSEDLRIIFILCVIVQLNTYRAPI